MEKVLLSFYCGVYFISVEFVGEGKGVLFSDGTTDEYDFVILATGYKTCQ